MPRANQKPIKSHKPFSGFVAHYDNGKTTKERENFYSLLLKKKCATSWAEIRKENLVALDIYWNDELKGTVTREPTETSFNKDHTLAPSDWFFSQKGYFDLGNRKIIVIARNIGYIKDGMVNILSVVEQSGIVQIYSRKA